MGANLYLDCPILLTKADQVGFCTVRNQGSLGHLYRSTPPRLPSPKVSQNPNNSESNTLKAYSFRRGRWAFPDSERLRA
jgi:hypothetical protein